MAGYAVNQKDSTSDFIRVQNDIAALNLREAIAYGLLLAASTLVFCRGLFADIVWVHEGVFDAGPLLSMLSASGMVLLLFKAWLSWRYRPRPPLALADAPAITVIIPAYNEGAMVEKSIDSVVAARYPPQKLQVIVVDDGSRDDTWTYISRAVARHGSRILAVRFVCNRGKRAALMEGFLRATGEIVVTVDSDSVIDPSALLAISAPFDDPRVGVVAGKVVVHNTGDGLIPRLVQFVFALSFDFQRAAESQFRTVYCSPGALAAYRATGLTQVRDAWMMQYFLGAACTYGEDRALTNCLLARGYDSVYQGNAVVRTLAPRNYAELCKMFLRWDRSFIREELRLAGIVWKRPIRYRLAVLWDKVTTDLFYPLQFATLSALPILLLDHPTLLPLAALSVALGSLPFVLLYYRFERSPRVLYGFVYAYFSVIALSWILPYAMITPRARSWLTR